MSLTTAASVTPSRRLRLAAVAAPAGAAIRWWLGELAAIIPERLRRALRRPERWIVLDLREGELVAGRIDGGGNGARRNYREIGRFALGDGDSSASTANRPAVPAAPRTAVAVRLPPEEVLRRSLDLPLAAERTLRAVLSHELERQTPFLADQVYFDCRVLELRASLGRIRVELAVVPRPVVGAALAAARRCGFEPARVGLLDDPDGPPRFDFMPARTEGEEQARPHRTTLLLAVLAVTLGGAAAYLWTDRAAEGRATFAGAIAQEKRAADAADALRKEIDRLGGHARFLASRQQAAPRLIDVLDALTHLLPDDTWIFEFQLNGREGHIVGYSPAASRLIGLFEASPLFKTPRFRSPLTQGPRSGVERFDLSFELRDDAPAQTAATAAISGGTKP